MESDPRRRILSILFFFWHVNVCDYDLSQSPTGTGLKLESVWVSGTMCVCVLCAREA